MKIRNRSKSSTRRKKSQDNPTNHGGDNQHEYYNDRDRDERRKRKRRDAIPRTLDLALLSNHEDGGSSLEQSQLYEAATESLLKNIAKTMRLLSDSRDELDLIMAFHEPRGQISELSSTAVLLQSILRYAPTAETLLEQKLKPFAERLLAKLGMNMGRNRRNLLSLCRSTFLTYLLVSHIRRYSIDLSCSRRRSGAHQPSTWTERSETVYVTLFELIAQETSILLSSSGKSSSKHKQYSPSSELQRAWKTTGHDDALETLHFLYGDDDRDDANHSNCLDKMISHRGIMFREACCDVLSSMDQACPVHPDGWGLFLRGGSTSDWRHLLEKANTTPANWGEGDSTAGSDSSSGLYTDEKLAAVPKEAVEVLNKVSGPLLERQDLVLCVLKRLVPRGANSTWDTGNDSIASLDSDDGNLNLLPLCKTGGRHQQGSVVALTPGSQNARSFESVVGTGKTTIAAIIAHHTEVRKHFRDGVAWISFKHRPGSRISYRAYRRLLEDIAKQLAASASEYDGESDIGTEELPVFPEMIPCIDEECSNFLLEEVEDGFKSHCFEEFQRTYSRGKKRILLILDNVPDDETLNWFRFNSSPLQSGLEDDPCFENQMSLLLTARKNLCTVAETVEVGLLAANKESVAMLLPNAEQADVILCSAVASARLNNALFAASVKRLLDYHCHNNHDERESYVKSICADVKVKVEREGFNSTIIFDQWAASMSPIGMKECIAAFVAVFAPGVYDSRFASLEPQLIPVATVDCLFREVLLLDVAISRKLDMDGLDEAAAQVRISLIRLGFLQRVNASKYDSRHKVPVRTGGTTVRLVHALHKEYAVALLAPESETTTKMQHLHHVISRSLIQTLIPHKKGGNNQQTIWGWKEPQEQFPMREYALAMLPVHLIGSNKIELFEHALELLGSQAFVHDRIFRIGIEEASERMVAEMSCLLSAVPDTQCFQHKVNKVYLSLGNHLFELFQQEGVTDTEVLQCGRAFLNLSLSLVEMQQWQAAIPLWEYCRAAFVSSLGELSEANATILYNLGIMYGKHQHRYVEAIQHLEECVGIRKVLHGENNILCAEALGALSDTFLMINDISEARSGYELALSLLRHKPRLHRKLIGYLQERLGGIYLKFAELEMSEQSFQSALLYQQAEHGEDSPRLFTVYTQLALCYVEQEEPELALEAFRNAIAVLENEESGAPSNFAHLIGLQKTKRVIHGQKHDALKFAKKAVALLQSKVSGTVESDGLLAVKEQVHVASLCFLNFSH